MAGQSASTSGSRFPSLQTLTAPAHGEYVSEIRKKVQDGDVARKVPRPTHTCV